jgi:hypothetical protein
MPADDAEEPDVEEQNRDLEEGHCSSVEGAAGDDSLSICFGLSLIYSSLFAGLDRP